MSSRAPVANATRFTEVRDQSRQIMLLDNPRGSTVTPDGELLVADIGVPGSDYPGRIVTTTSETWGAFHFGAATSGDSTQEFLSGLSDLAMFDGDMFVVTGAGGWLEQPLYAPNQLLRLTENGEAESVFDFAEFEAERDPDQNGTDSNATGVAITKRGAFWISDGAGNWVAHLSPDGEVRTVVAFPDVAGAEAVPSGLAVGSDDAVYVTLFHCQPNTEASSGGIAKVMPDGSYEIIHSGLDQPVDVAINAEGHLYVLEFSDSFAPETGRLLRFDGDGVEVVVSGLRYPTSIAVGSQGELFVTGINAPAGGTEGSGYLQQVLYE